MHCMLLLCICAAESAAVLANAACIDKSVARVFHEVEYWKHASIVGCGSLYLKVEVYMLL